MSELAPLREAVDTLAERSRPPDFSELQNRATRRGRRRIGVVAAATVVLAVSTGGVLATRDGDRALDPVGTPVRNGEVVVAETGPTGWLKFDQRTGSFLYFLAPDDHVDAAPHGDYSLVVGDLEVAHLECPFAEACYGLEAFGPGSDEVSIVDVTGSELRVVGYDGSTRSTIDLAGAIEGEKASGIAWSPDGSQLAVSTDCEPIPVGCEAKVWVLDRDGSNPRVVHTEAGPKAVYGSGVFVPLLREVSWSPDGETLAFIAHTDTCGAAADAGVWPRLVTLSLQSGQAAKTLHVYNDIDCHGDLFPSHYSAHYNLAWSPDGTRLAVTTATGFSQISAEDGEVLAGHPVSPSDGQHVTSGPLGWMRAP